MSIQFNSRTEILTKFRENNIDVSSIKHDEKQRIFEYINKLFSRTDIPLKTLHDTLITALKVSQELLNNPRQKYDILFTKFSKYYGDINQEIFEGFIEMNIKSLETVSVHRNGIGNRKYNLSNILGGCKTNYTNSTNEIRAHIKKKFNNAINSKKNDSQPADLVLNNANYHVISIDNANSFTSPSNSNKTIEIAKVIISKAESKSDSAEVYELFQLALNNNIFELSDLFHINYAKEIIKSLIKRSKLNSDEVYKIIKHIFLKNDIDLVCIAESVAIHLRRIMWDDASESYKKLTVLFQENENLILGKNYYGVNFLKNRFNELLGIHNKAKNSSSRYVLKLKLPEIRIGHDNSEKSNDYPNYSPITSPAITRVNSNSDIAKQLEEEIQYITSQEQIKYISNNVNDSAKAFFKKIFNIESIGNSTNPSTIVLGDADGSVGRVMLAAIQSGHMSLKSTDALNNLIAVLSLEALTRNLSSFQMDQNTAVNLEKILKEAEFKNGDYELIFIGDIIHDRFSNNKVVMGNLIKFLYDKGVIFIRGNHDAFDHCFIKNVNGESEARLGIGQAGEFAIVPLEYEAALEVEKNFVNCYYDSKKNKFYVHNGILYNENSKEYITAFGDIKADEIENINMLVKKINELQPDYNADKFTNFRPKDIDMQDLPIFIKNDCVMVHGHNASQGTTGKVCNINSRGENNQFLAIAIKF